MKIIGAFFLLLFFTVSVSAGVTVNSSVDRNKMGEGDTFTLTLTVSSEDSFSISEPELPDLSGFDLLNTWTESENFSTFANGQFQVQRNQKYHYMLAPQKMGNFQIKSISVNINGQTFNTKPIDISVVAGGVAPTPKPQRGQPTNPMDDVDDIFSQFLRRRPHMGGKNQQVDPNDSFFIQVEVDKTEVYAGEQITATFYLYTRAQISDIDTLKYPSLNGFWKEDIEVATRLGFQDEVINGLIYRKALLASYALFPINPGKSVIDSYQAKCTVVSPTAFGFGKPTVLTKQSKEVTINVKPLPNQTTSGQFVGGIGNFKLSSTIDTNTVPINQPITWKLRFFGSGNAKLIELPKFELPDGIELYDTKSTSKFEKNGESFKEFEILLIPRKSGEHNIPELTFSLFNPGNSKYYTVVSESKKLLVQEAEGGEAIPNAPLEELKKEVENLKKVYSPEIILSWKGSNYNFGLAQTLPYWMVLYLLSFVYLIWKSINDFTFEKRKKDIQSILDSRFKKIHNLVDKQEWRQVGVHVMNCFYFLIGEMAGQGGASEEVEKLILKVSPSVRRELGDDLLKLLKKFEILSFAPEGVVGVLKEKKELKQNVSEMEKLLNKAVKLGLGKNIHD
jgi:hypothetical protein